MSEHLGISIGGEALVHEPFGMRHNTLGRMKDSVVGVEKAVVDVAEDIPRIVLSVVRDHPIFVATGLSVVVSLAAACKAYHLSHETNGTEIISPTLA